MRLQETILEAIKPENFERKEKNQFMLDYQSKYMEFDEVAINIKRQGSESYIDVNFGVTYDTDHCDGSRDTAPSSGWQVLDVTLTFLNIMVDGIHQQPGQDFKNKVKEEIKKQLIFEIE